LQLYKGEGSEYPEQSLDISLLKGYLKDGL